MSFVKEIKKEHEDASEIDPDLTTARLEKMSLFDMPTKSQVEEAGTREALAAESSNTLDQSWSTSIKHDNDGDKTLAGMKR